MKLPKELTTVTPLSKYFAMILFISLPFIGFFMGMNYQSMLDLSDRQQTDISLTAIKRSPTPTQENISGWETYKNVQYKFEFKYPNNWILGEEQDKDAKSRGVPRIYLRPNFQRVSKDNLTHGEITIRLYNGIQLNEYVKGLCDSPEICVDPNKIEKIIISNIEAFRIKNIPGPLPSEKIVFSNKNQMIVFHFNYNGPNYIDFSNKNSKQVFDQILSTFKFIN